MESNPQDYQSYLLRMWRARDDGKNWQASLENLQTGELHGFSKLADLINYLNETTQTEGVKTIVLAYQEKPNKKTAAGHPDARGNSWMPDRARIQTFATPHLRYTQGH